VGTIFGIKVCPTRLGQDKQYRKIQAKSSDICENLQNKRTFIFSEDAVSFLIADETLHP